MPTTPSDDQSLINDFQLIEGTDRPAAAAAQNDRPKDVTRTRYADAFDALESGLPIEEGSPEIGAADAQGPSDWDDARDSELAPGRTFVSFMTAALVLVVSLTVGGATAALVLHDRVMQITASWTASR